jgi:hypothetical protein
MKTLSDKHVMFFIILGYVAVLYMIFLGIV